jgi:hypothetical protein
LEPVAARVWLALLLLMVAGLGLRLWNLGALGLVADEGHQALAVQGILEHGIPLVPAGNIYLRGAPFLYSEAAAAAIGGSGEAMLRLPAAIFGTLTILATFLFARRLLGVRVALTAALFVTFSLWELELSRYARMYTLLQLAFVAGAYAFVRGELDDQPRWRLATYACMLLAIVSHQLGVMVVLFFLIPAFLDEAELPPRLRGAGRYRLLLPPLVLGGIWLVYHRLVGHLMFRTATPGLEEATERVAPGLLGIVETNVRVPHRTMPLDLWSVDRPVVLVAALVLLAFALLVAISTWRQPGRRLRGLVAIAVLAASTFNLFAVTFGLAIFAVVLFGGGWSEYRRPPWIFAWVGSAALLVYWIVYLQSHPAALDPGWGEPWSVGAVLTAYPPFKSRVLDWFLRGWPVMTPLVAAGVLGLVAGFVFDRRRGEWLVAAAVLVIPLIVVTFGRELHNEARYHFHVYPFIVMVFALAITLLARGVTAAVDIVLATAGRPFAARPLVEGLLIIALGFGLCRDLAPRDLWSCVTRDYSTSKDPIRGTLNWLPYATFHQDHATPAAYVREQIAPGDRIAFFGPLYWASIYWYYLGQVDYAVSKDATGMRREDGVFHHVTGARCITAVEELDQVLAAERHHRVWLLGDLQMLSDASSSFSPVMKARLRALALPWHYLGRDSNTLVRRLDAETSLPAGRSGDEGGRGTERTGTSPARVTEDVVTRSR